LLYEEFNDFFDVARKRHIIFFYVGYFSQHVVAAISETIKARLDVAGAAGPTRRRIFSSFVEMSQNIMHYSSDTLTPDEQAENQMRRGSFCIGMKGDSFFLLCANPVDSANVERIRNPPRTAAHHDDGRDQVRLQESPARRNPGRQQGRRPGLPDHGARRQRAAGIRIRQDAHNPDATIFCIKAII
jgi:hypothetical protein